MRGHAPAGKSMNAPLFVFTQQLNAELYAAAFAMWEGHLSLLHSRSVRMVLCWAVALVLIASIPAVARMSGDWFLLAALAMGAMGASFYFWRMHPAAMLQKGRMLFLGAPLLHEKFTHTFYEDRVESESERNGCASIIPILRSAWRAATCLCCAAVRSAGFSFWIRLSCTTARKRMCARF